MEIYLLSRSISVCSCAIDKHDMGIYIIDIMEILDIDLHYQITYPMDRPYTLSMKGRNNTYLLCCILDGSGLFEQGGISMGIHSGELLVFKVDKNPISTTPDQTGPLFYYTVLFQIQDDEPDIKKQLAALQSLSPISIGGGHRFFFEDLRQKHSSIQANLRFSADYQLVSFLFLVGTEPDSSISDSMIESMHLEKALRIMQRQVSAKLTLEELCEELQLTDSYFIRLFNKRLSQPPMKYYMQLKILVAKTLLATTSMPVKDISVRLSFSNEFHFSKQFKAVSGYSPSQYRKIVCKQ